MSKGVPLGVIRGADGSVRYAYGHGNEQVIISEKKIMDFKQKKAVHVRGSRWR
jgi:hypothetical protein